MPASSRQFVVILPVKPLALGKSRLGALAADRRRSLAAAFALDTAQAALQTPGVTAVLAVTDDHLFAAQLAAVGCSVIPDGAAEDLNHTLTQAAAEVERSWPQATPVVVCADLPSLRPEELAEVLAGLPEQGPAFLSDATGTGTTVYGAPVGSFAPRFGLHSAQSHRDDGAVEILVAAPSVRRDVDDLADLAVALGLGVGPRTAAVGAHD